MQNSVPEALDSALAIARSLNAEQVIALLCGGTYASSTSSTSSSTSSAPSLTTEWQKKVETKLRDDELNIVEDGVNDQNNPDQALDLLLGENKSQWPLGQFSIRTIRFIPPAIRQLLLNCGAVIVGNNLEGIRYVMLAADFDSSNFSDGLVALQMEEQDESFQHPFIFACA